MKRKIISFDVDCLVSNALTSSIINSNAPLHCNYDDEYENLVLTYNELIIGTIAKKDKWRIENLVFRNNVTLIKAKNIQDHYLHVELTLESFLDDSTIPKAIEGDVAGIYKISINQDESVYIGQSGNVNRRIVKHWQELSVGTHHNRPLQSHWDSSANDFSVTILEKLVEGYEGSYQQQKFLEDREKYWISNYKQKTNVLNRTEGEVVKTKRAVDEFEEKSRREDEINDIQVKLKRKEINAAIKQLEEERKITRGKRDANLAQAKDLKKYLFKNTGLIGLFLSSARKSDIQAKQTLYLATQDEIRTSDTRIKVILENIQALKSERRRFRTTREQGIKQRKFQ
jgi:hypothetical protein